MTNSVKPDYAATEYKGIKTLDIKLMTKGSVPKAVFDTLIFRASGVSHIRSMADLSRSILEYVHLHNLEAAPVSLARLNRVFGRPARSLKVSIRTVVEELISADKLSSFRRLGKSGLITTPLFNELPSVLDTLGYVEGSDDYNNALDAWAKATV